jgi:capsular exopolysaccharide synthesis family protein
MTLRDFLKLTRRRLGPSSPVPCSVPSQAAALLLTTPTTYSAQATAYVRVSVPKGADGAAQSNSYFAASQLANQKVKAFVSVFTSQSVAEGVIKELKLDTTPADLAGSIKASNATNSLTIVVTAAGDSPEHARNVADAVVTQSSAQVKVLEGANSPVEVVMMTPASLSQISKAPSPVKYLTVGILAGLVIGYIAAFARQHFDTRLRTADDVAEQFDAPVLAVLPQSKDIARTEGGSDEDFQSAESLRKLRTNLRYANVDHQAKVILVTSPLQGDGKSSVAASLAKVMAVAGDDVVLVDTDLRRPSVAETFDLHGPLGLLQILIGSAKVENTLRPTKITGLSVLPAFDTPPNPSELLGSDRMARLVKGLSRDHIVILDAPPVLPVTDAVVLSHLTDAVVVVASAGRTRTEQLEHAISSIERGEGKIAGIVLNRAASSKLARLRYGDAEYGYEYTDSEYTAADKRRTAQGHSKAVHTPNRLRKSQVDLAAHPSGREEASETRRMPVVAYTRDNTMASTSPDHQQLHNEPQTMNRPLWRSTSDGS